MLGVPANINDERIQALTQLRDTLSKSDPGALFNVVNELSSVRINHQQSLLEFCLYIK
jgi:hypothetical protein